MKKIGIGLLVLVLCFALAACGGDKLTQVRDAFNSGMTAFKTMDEAGINKFFTDADQLDMEVLSEQAGADMAEVFKLLCANCEWNVAGGEITGETEASLTVSLKNLNLSSALDDVSEELYDWAYNAALNGEAVDEEMIGEKLVEFLKARVESTTSGMEDTVTVDMVLEDGQWKIDTSGNGDLLTMLTGGLSF